MAFENISKGETTIDESNFGRTNVSFGDFCGEIEFWHHHNSKEESIENAKFVSFAFNLQQRYDISKLEEAVEILEDYKDVNPSDRKLEELLKQIKK